MPSFEKKSGLKNYTMAEPSTLSCSPHVQRFTLKKFKEIISSSGYDVKDCKGSALIRGPLSNAFFTGIKWVMKLNNRLGEMFPSFSSGFYIYATKNEQDEYHER